ncbi:tRNA uracil 4-sulfurtransferase ThiI [Fervidicoccus fontis]|uniref:Probable tRNA sulfurtransferase n=3 Tax=Fervidicoccus fontis TaxID=683846 RepID=I0A2F2_FERFK|nr:tRNA uracil 4-sulfurtransferase ThiI [Fervidicoccus fontis]AFH43159.1 thiamine biosynthesis protein ThiI [Fervidicoccus fontis Kam940]
MSWKKMDANCIIARFGEIGIKGKITRGRMQSILAKNIENALKSNGFERSIVRVIPGRVLVTTPEDPRKEAELISRVFGVTSSSPALMGEYRDLDDLVDKVSEASIEDVRGKVFMVRGRRADENRFTSKDIERRIGAKLQEMGAGKVNLESPEISIYVEARKGLFFVYKDIINGVGGLPLGSELKILSLVSGGFDSPVAAWMLMKRGSPVDILFFNIGGKEHKEYFLDVAKKLICGWSYGPNQNVYIVEHRWIFPYLFNYFPEGYRTVALKVSMYVGAEALAKSLGIKAISTGENLAQVSSQTVHNLAVTESFIDIPVFRPLIGFDKEEIIELSKKVGTYEVSSRVPEFCAIASSKASTAVDGKKLETFFEKYLPLNEIKQNVLDNVKKIEKKDLCSSGPVA